LVQDVSRRKKRTARSVGRNFDPVFLEEELELFKSVRVFRALKKI